MIGYHTQNSSFTCGLSMGPRSDVYTGSAGCEQTEIGNKMTQAPSGARVLRTIPIGQSHVT